MRRERKRRLFPVVDRSLQYRFLMMVLCYCLIIVAVLAFFLLVPDVVQLLNENLSLELRAKAAEKILALHSRLWPAIITVVCVLGLHSWKVFHRVVGPLYRFRVAFIQVKGGDLGLRIKLREKDYLHQEEEAFNEMVETLAENWGGIQLAGLDALESLGRLEQAMSRTAEGQAIERQLLAAHREHLERLVDIAGSFRLRQEEDEAIEPIS